MDIEGNVRLLGQVVGEFRKDESSPDDVYTNNLKGLAIIKAVYPGKGGWNVVMLTDCGFEKTVPLDEIVSSDKRYYIGAPRIIMHEAGLDEDEESELDNEDQEGDDF